VISPFAIPWSIISSIIKDVSPLGLLPFPPLEVEPYLLNFDGEVRLDCFD